MLDLDRVNDVMVKVVEAVKGKFPEDIQFAIDREEDDPPAMTLILNGGSFFGQLSVWANGKVAALSIEGSGEPWLNEDAKTDEEGMPLLVGKFVRACMDRLEEAAPDAWATEPAEAKVQNNLNPDFEPPPDPAWEEIGFEYRDGGLTTTTERMKVPGGWLYARRDAQQDALCTAMVFVPGGEE